MTPHPRSIHHPAKPLAVAGLAFLLAACGGASSDGPSRVAAEPTTEAAASETTRAAAPDPTPRPAQDAGHGAAVDVLATGSEPFWMTEVTPEGITFIDVGRQDTLRWGYVEPRSPANRRPVDTRVYFLGGDAGDAAFVVLGRACTDGMSGKTYPMTALMLVDQHVFEGCARTPDATDA